MSEPSSSSNTPKAIGSLAKKQSDVTRQGAAKLKFVPTLPQRRKKEDVKAEPAPAAVPAESSERGRGRGRGRGEGRGRGRGRGGPPVVEMTASGPFAMGPAMAGSSNTSRRATPRSNFVPSVPSGGSTPSSFGANLSNSAPPGLRNELRGPAAANGIVKTEVDGEVYSDPDDGVEIIDMDNVRQMDWMAPENLKKERQAPKKLKVKKEEPAEDTIMEEVDTRNAVNLEESEDEDELEDIIEDFATQAIEEENADSALREDRLFFFQFPSPFPKFTSKNVAAMDVDAPAASTSTSVPAPTADGTGGKKVSFAPDVKPEVRSTSSRTPSVVPPEAPKAKEAVPVDGVIGQLEVYKSGAVKIRLANGILLDVSAATQPSFLQQAVLLDQTNGHLTVLGEVNKQFVVSPNVDALLEALDNADDSASLPGLAGAGLIRMD